MPMFYTPKPRQFHYEPRFYDPEKEEWEAKKRKYAFEHAAAAPAPAQSEEADYFERRLKELDEKEKRQRQRLGVKDFFCKREMPKFNPQFHPTETASVAASPAPKQMKFRRRFDVEDPDSFKPAPAGKIIVYVGLVCLLLYWILN